MNGVYWFHTLSLSLSLFSLSLSLQVTTLFMVESPTSSIPLVPTPPCWPSGSTASLSNVSPKACKDLSVCVCVCKSVCTHCPFLSALFYLHTNSFIHRQLFLKAVTCDLLQSWWWEISLQQSFSLCTYCTDLLADNKLECTPFSIMQHCKCVAAAF